ALADRTRHCRNFNHTLAQALARHLQEPKMADVADLNTRPVVAQRVLELAFYRAIITPFIHIDEVDDDQTGEVAEADLPRNFLGCLEIRLQRRVLDGIFARRTAGV